MVGTEQAMTLSFGSTAHGAGRILSRSAAKRKFQGSEVKNHLRKRGIVIQSTNQAVLAEEAPGAYKDVDRVVNVSHHLAIATKVARLTPLAVIKG
jgi:tRNA-splicing ligase RtcB